MILDSSALVAFVLREEGWEELLSKMEAAETLGVGTPTLAETGLVLASRLTADSTGVLLRILLEFDVRTIPFGDAHWREAVRAFRRYGKGRHPAGLNFGDCLTYATAKLAGQPLLSAGRDFEKTDLERA